jgi:hypothetical protein
MRRAKPVDKFFNAEMRTRRASQEKNAPWLGVPSVDGSDGGSRMGGDLIEISPGRCGFSLHRALQKIDFSASATSA